MTVIFKVLIGLVPFAIGVFFWIRREIKTAPEYGKCLKCNGDFPKFYITSEGICQHCDYQNKAKESLGGKTK